MKKLFLILTILGLFLFSSCNTASSIGTASDNTNVAPSDNTNVAPSSLPSDKQVLSPMQTFKEVLLNEKTFFCTDKSPYYNIVHQWNGYLNEVTYENTPMITPQFAVVDLDGDGVPEIVLAIENYNGFVILRYKEGNVFGNIVSYRTMDSLKRDGSFMSSSGASDNSMGKMLFIGDTYFLNEKIRSVGGGDTDSYYIHDLPIDKDTWDKSLVLFEDTPDVEWHDYSKEEINQWLLDSPDSLEMPELQKIAIADRQNYLDSLAYLIDLTNSNIKSQEQINDNARSYYNGCNDEMNKIYQLYSEKLSGDELEALSREQQRWQENFNQRLSVFLSEHLVNSMDDLADQSWYYSFGDMMLRRTIRLVNLYYENHYYD